ncbi:MAG: glycosyltransferase family 2 protein [Akkermansia sp.]|nr:glycosyltransferase family 2 protein [Akkermansia sp.]
MTTLSTDFISIIIPVYKVEAYIQPCIASVINQTHRHLEILLVDDCGDDQSITLAEELLRPSGLEWKVLRHEKNRGLSAARNTGAAHAQGNYLFFLDSDDYLAPHALEKLLRKAQETQADMVFGNLVYDTDGVLAPCMWTRQKDAPAPTDPLNAHVRRLAFPMAWNRLIKRDFYTSSGVSFIEGLIHEDEPWSFSLIVRTGKVAFVQATTYYYRQRSGAITSEKRSDFPRLYGKYVWLKTISDESAAFGLSRRTDVQEWYQNCILNVLDAVKDSTCTGAEKYSILHKLFTELQLPELLTQRNHLFRLAKACSFLLPRYRWISFYHLLRKLKAKLGSKRRS